MKIITSFTAAHSVTLALATLNLIHLPQRVVEPLIAVFIVCVGVENPLNRHPKRRWLLTFGFGLIHGFGFASALQDIGIAASGAGVAVPLVSFNVGVELGQLGIAALAFPLIWKMQSQAGPAIRFARACSMLVAIAGAWWLLQPVVSL